MTTLTHGSMTPQHRASTDAWAGPAQDQEFAFHAANQWRRSLQFTTDSAGETLVPELVNRADVVLSINALDHGYDFDAAIQNIAAYLKPNAPAFLSFDLHEKADAMHPLVLTEASCRATFAAAGLTVTRVMEGVGPFGTNYGHGAAIDFWLLKPRD